MHRNPDPGQVNQINDIETPANDKRKFALTEINNAKIKFQLDGALDITIIAHDNRETFLNHTSDTALFNQPALQAKQSIDIWGYFECKVKLNG